MKRFLIAAVLLAVTLPPGTVAAHNAYTTPSAHTAILAPLALAQRDQQNLAAARPDARNLYDLTRRLKLHSLASINPYVRSTAPNYAVGRVDTFWVAQATSGYFSLKAKLLLKSPHAYWYVQEHMGIPQARLMAALRISAHDFETHVYPTDHAAFGREWTPGVDHDPRITILCANLPGVGGYYSAEDLYPRAVNPFSNQRKMLYVNITAFALGSRDFASTIAHELQHMIHWYQHERDDTWINEGSSVLAQVLTGYTPDGQDQAFAADPGTQLDDFCYGPPGCIDGGAYGYHPTYHGCCVHARVTASTSSYPFVRRARVNQFATNYVELTPGRASTLHVQFRGDSTVHIVPNTPLQDGLEWWSNR